MLCLVFYILHLQLFLLFFNIHFCSYQYLKYLCPCKVAVVSLLPPATSCMRRVQPVEVLSLRFKWSSETKIKPDPYVITFYLVIGAPCAVPSVGISISFLQSEISHVSRVQTYSLVKLLLPELYRASCFSAGVEECLLQGVLVF